MQVLFLADRVPAVIENALCHALKQEGHSVDVVKGPVAIGVACLRFYPNMIDVVIADLGNPQAIEAVRELKQEFPIDNCIYIAITGSPRNTAYDPSLFDLECSCYSPPVVIVEAIKKLLEANTAAL